MDRLDSPERTEPTLATEATEYAEAAEAAEPIDRIEPADPTERIEPAEPIDRIEPTEPILRIDPFDPMLRIDFSGPMLRIDFSGPIDHREPRLSLMPGILSPWSSRGNAATRAEPAAAVWPVHILSIPVVSGGQVRRAATLVASAIAVLATTTSACGASSPARQASPRTAVSSPTTYYLSVGDSLSRGVQPNTTGTSVPTRQGYPDQLYAALRRSHPGLRLVKLGCGGETTTTMIDGGICSYPAGSQLAAAVRFLRAHSGRVSLITIDIGANDSGSCLSRPTVSGVATCVAKSIPGTVDNLTKIMSRLRAAAGPKVRIIGMTYYVPSLAQWRGGLMGQTLARFSEGLVTTYNKVLTGIYKAHGARVADVFTAFHSEDFTDHVTLPRIGQVPRNVAAICTWTWECAPEPRGPNIHANPVGYGVIALTFLLAARR